MKILLVFLIAIPFVHSADPVILQVFQYAYFQGDSRSYNIEGCTQFGFVGTQVASAKLTGGTCVKLYKSYNCVAQGGCNGTICHITYPSLREEILSKELFHDLNSARPCATSSRTVLCPKGTWIRRMDFGADDLRSGITIRCYEPGKKSPSTILNTNGRNLTSYSSQSCKGAARGVKIVKDEKYNIISKAAALCSFSNNIGSDSLQCDKTDGLVGITVVVEELSNVIKSIKPICRKVEDPSKLCQPTDTYVPLVQCDNAQGFTATTCQYQVQEGVGISKTLSETISLSLNFYGEFGFGAGGGFRGLKANFEGKLGLSVTTQFDWTKASTTTWNEQTQIQVTVSTPPGIITLLEQVVGKCSFYEVDVNYFKRIDTRGNTTEITLLTVPNHGFTAAIKNETLL